MSAKYKSPSFLLPNELNTSANPANDTGINSLYSMDFSGSGDKIQTGLTPPLGDSSRSISLWFYTSNSSSHNICGYGAASQVSGHNGFDILTTTGNYVGIHLFGTAVIAGGTYNLNAWNHYVITYDGTTLQGYLNGVAVDSNNTEVVNTLSTNDFIIGEGVYTGFNGFSGKIDEVAIFNRALNTTERAALYGGTIPNIYPSNLMATDLNPVAYYPLGEQAQMQGYLGNEASSEWQFPNGVLQDYVMDFDGTDNINSEANISSASSFTASIWINRDDSATQYIYGQWIDGTTASQSWVVQTVGGIVYFNVRDASLSVKSAISTISLTTGIWYNIIAVWTGSNIKLYINNSLEDTTACSSMNNPSTAVKLAIGSSSNNVSPFNGKISNAVIWNSDQSANKDNIYNNGSPQTTYTVTPQNWWKLNSTSVYTPSAPNYTTALSFVDTPGDKIEITSPSSSMQPTTTLTLSFWANFKQDANWMLSNGGWGQSSSAYSGYSIQTYNGRSLKFWIGNGTASGSFTTSASVFNLNQWHHILITYDSGTAILYIDGNVVPWSGTGGINSIAYSASYNPFFGSVNSGGTSFNAYEGFLSNAAIFNTAFTPSQVSTLFNFGTPETNISFSPTAWWKLDNTTTGIQDSSGNGNNGTNNGTTQVSSSVAVVPSWKIPSALTIPTINYKTALDFDGNTNYVTAGTTSYLNNVTEMSLSIWFNLDTAAQNKGLISDYNGTTTGHFALVTKGILGNNYSLRLYMNNGGPESSIQIANQPFIAGQWHNLVMIYANSTISFYIDGQPAASSAYSGTTPSSFANSTNTLNIGKYSTLEWNGLISNAQIWTTELSSSDALSIYNNGQPSTTAFGSPVSWWKLDSTTITDSAGSNNGTNNGAAQVTSDVYSGNIPVNGVSTTLPSTALQQSDLQFDSPYSNYSLSFDGTGYIDCGDSDIFSFGNGSSDNPFSISAWINITATTSQGIVTKYGSSTSLREWLFYTTGGKIRLLLWSGSTNNIATSSTVLSTNTWYHVLATYDGRGGSTAYDGINIYVNGVLESVTKNGGSYTAMSNTSQPVQIATHSGGSFLDGKIDETSIFNYSLSEAQVLEIYNNGRPKDLSTFSGTAPISWWRLGENAYFQDSTLVLPNSIIGAPNGEAATNNLEMISADAPGTYANGVGENLDILDRVGDAPLSTSNSQSYNMIPDDKSPYVPAYVGLQTDNIYSMDFDSASSDYIDLGANFYQVGSGDVSISVWIKPQSQSGNNDIIAIGANTGSRIRLQRRGNNFGAYINNSAGSGSALTGSTTITNGVWYHLALIKSGTTFTLYVNTTSEASGTFTGTFDSQEGIIGAYFGGGSNNINGQIDEVAIWDTALNAGQIFNDLYQPTSTATNKTADLVNNPNLPNPVAWYRMGD